MMRWNLGKKRIELSYFNESIPGRELRAEIEPTYYITFEPTKGGIRAKHAECVTNLMAFLKDPKNGDNSQWPDNGDLQRFTRELWRAAVHLGGDSNELDWGFPVWEVAEEGKQ